VENGGVRIERQGELAILRLDKARGNAIDEPMVRALAAAAAELDADDATRGILLASAHPKLFCPGLDLVALVDYDREAMRRFFVRFEEAMPAERQQWLATVAARAFFESYFALDEADRAAHARFLAEIFPKEIAEVRFTTVTLNIFDHGAVRVAMCFVSLMMCFILSTLI